MVGSILQTDQIKHSRYPVFDIRFSDLGQNQWNGHILGDGLGFKQIVMLKNHTDFMSQRSQIMPIKISRILSQSRYRATGRGFKTVDGTNQRALSRSGRTDNPEERTRWDFKSHIIKSFEPTIPGLERFRNMRKGNR